MKKLSYLLFFLLAILGTESLNAQDNLKVAFQDASSVPNFLNICGDPDQVSVVISLNGQSSGVRKNIQARLHLFKGVELSSFNANTSTPGVTLLNNTDPSNPVFSIPNLSPSGLSSVHISYAIAANCQFTDTLALTDTLEVYDVWEFHYDLDAQIGLNESDVNTEYRDAFKIPFFTMAATNTAVFPKVGDCFTRTIKVNNSGLDGFVNQILYSNTQGGGISVHSITVNGIPIPITKQVVSGGDTLIKATITGTYFSANTSGNGPSDGDAFFDPDETITIVESACLVSCVKSRTSKHVISWGCDNVACRSITVQDFVYVGEGSVNINFAPSGTIPNHNTGYCTQGVSTVKFSNDGVAIDPGTADMTNITLGIGLGNGFKKSDNGFRITAFRIAGILINNPDSLVALNNNPLFVSDPDGPGGLEDLDNDGYFDDMTTGSSLEITAYYEIDCAFASTATPNVSCVNNLATGFSARLDYTNFCNERVTYLKNRYFGPSHVNDSFENCSDPDTYTDGTKFHILHFERRNVFNFEKTCNGQEQMIVTIAIPPGIDPLISEITLARFTDTFPLISHTLANDTLVLVYNASLPTFLNGDYNLNMYFQANCNAVIGPTEFFTKIEYYCPPCDCRHIYYCGNITGPRIHWKSPPCAPNPAATCPQGISTVDFDVNRTTFGYTDANFTTHINPANANKKVAISCDSVEMRVLNVVGNTPISDSIGVTITYSNVENNDSTSQIFLFEHGTVRVHHNGVDHFCSIDTSNLKVQAIDSLKILRFNLNNCVQSLGFALSAGDTIDFRGYFGINPDGPYPLQFKKVPNLRAYGYYIQNGDTLVCDNFGDLFTIAKVRTAFSYPSSASFPKGCKEAKLEYRLITVNNGYKDYFGNEYRQAVAIDSIRFTYDPLILKAFGTFIAEVAIPDHPIFGNAFFPVHTFDSTGFYVARFDTLTKVPSLNKVQSYAFDFRIRTIPSCKSESGSATGNNKFDFNPEIFYKDRYYAKDIGDGSCVKVKRDSVNNDIVYSDTPELSLAPLTPPLAYPLNDTATWVVKLCNTSAKGDAGVTWFSIEDSTQTIQVVSMEDITNQANIKTLTVKQFGTGGNKYFALADGLKVAAGNITVNDICNFIRVKAVVIECGNALFNANAGWDCIAPSDVNWNPEDYPPCEFVQLPLSVSSAEPFLDANFVNQLNNKPGICDTTTLELLLRNTDTGPAFNLVSKITIPLQGATLIPGSFEVAYPSSAAYTPAISDPLFSGLSIKGQTYTYNGFDGLNTWLSQNGLPGFNAIQPSDSNEIKIKFRFTNDCDFKSGSLTFHNFVALSACGNNSNQESGESLPLLIEGADPNGKLFSVQLGPQSLLIPNSSSNISIIIKNLSAVPSDENDEISIKLPVGVDYVPGSSIGTEPIGWIPGDPVIQDYSGIHILTWRLPTGLQLDDKAELTFSVISPDFDCTNSSTQVAVSTLNQQNLFCQTSNSSCQSEIITSEGGEQIFDLLISQNLLNMQFVSITSSCEGQNFEKVHILSNIINADANEFPAQPFQVRYYDDVNGDGQLDAGDQLIHEFTENGPIPALGSIQVSEDLDVSLLQICHLLVLVDPGILQTCPSTELPIPIPQLINAGDDQVFCSDGISDIQTQLGQDNCSVAYQYNWSAIPPASTNDLSALNIPNPMLVVGNPGLIQDTLLYVLETIRPGCSVTNDTVMIIRAVPAQINPGPTVNILSGSSAQLNPIVSGGAAPLTFQWDPGIALDNASIQNPVTNTTQDITYHLTVTTASGCQSVDSIPVIITQDSIIVIVTYGNGFMGEGYMCKRDTAQLMATGGTDYFWYPDPNNPPGGFMSDVNISDPLFYGGLENNSYIWNLIVTDVNHPGLSGHTKITIHVLPDPDITITAEPASVTCPNAPVTLTATGAIDIYWQDIDFNDLGDGPELVVYPTEQTTYWAIGYTEDGCADFSRLTIHVVPDEVPPIIDGVPDDVTIQCDGSFPSTGDPIAFDNCDPDVALVLEENTVQIDDCTYETTRVWTATDDSGNASTATQTIVQTDNQAPVIVFTTPQLLNFADGDTLVLDCADGPPQFGMGSVSITDACDANPGGSFVDLGIHIGNCQTDGYHYLLSCQWTAVDACGNSNSLTIFIKIVDNLPPLLLGVPQDITLSPGEQIPAPATPATVDNCASAVNLQYQETQGSGSQIIRTWTATDDCGNQTVKTQNITLLQDLVPPVITIQNPFLLSVQTGDTLVYECSDPHPALAINDVSAVDDISGDVLVTFDSTVITSNNCILEGYTQIYRFRWTAKDANLNESVYQLFIKYIDTHPPVLTGIPVDITILSTDPVPNPAVPIATDACDPQPEIIYEELESGIGCQLIIKRNWIATDACGNSSSSVQSIALQCNSCPDLIPNSSILFFVPNCDTIATVCLPILMDQLTDYSIEVDGTPYSGDLLDCDADSVFAYAAFLVPGQGNQGPYHVDSWLVNGTTFSGDFENISGLIDSMNNWDPDGHWMLLQNTYSIIGGAPGQNYGVMDIVQISTGAYVLLDANKRYIPTGTSMNLELGNHEIVFVNNIDGCTDTLAVKVLCDNFPQMQVNETIQVTNSDTLCFQNLGLIGAIDNIVNQCPDISSGEVLFSLDPVSGCVIYTGLNVGIDTACLTICTDSSDCVNLTLVVSVIPPQVNPQDRYFTIYTGDTDTTCMDLDEIIGNALSIKNDCTILSGEKVLFEFMDSTCVRYTGVEPGTEKACIVLCDQLGVCDTTNLYVTVLPLISDITPIAHSDTISTHSDYPVYVNILNNDSINGILDTIFISQPPQFGVAQVTTGIWMIQYSPDDGYCNPIVPDSFQYTICNTAGCDSAMVFVYVNCANQTIYNGMSPNGDGKNDAFYIEGAQNLPGNRLMIFNRWGNRVYFKENYQNDWEGKWEGKDVPDGTYFYLFDDGQGHLKSGYLEIER